MVSVSPARTRFSIWSTAIGFVVGLVLGPLALDQASRQVQASGDRLVLTRDVALCVDEQVPCSPENRFGGLAARTIVPVDSKGFATLTFRVAAPYLSGAFQVVPKNQPPEKRLILADPNARQ